jgi:hypothetical protein
VKPLGAIPSLIWSCSIMRTELAAARRTASVQADHRKVD